MSTFFNGSMEDTVATLLDIREIYIEKKGKEGK